MRKKIEETRYRQRKTTIEYKARTQEEGGGEGIRIMRMIERRRNKKKEEKRKEKHNTTQRKGDKGKSKQ